MSTVTLEIPPEYARSFVATGEEAARKARIELALELYRGRKRSNGKAAQFAGEYPGAFVEPLRDRDIPRHYTKEMLDQNLRYAVGRL